MMGCTDVSAQTRELLLDGVGIDEISEAVAGFLKKANLDRRSAISARLSFENCLLELRDHFGDGTPAVLWIGKRLGRSSLQVRVVGDRFDPRESKSLYDWESSLLENAGLKPGFSYRGGTCILSLSQPLPEIDSTVISFFALIFGFGISILGNFLPADVRLSLLNDLVDPLVNLFIAMLTGIAGPLVFFSVEWGICGIGDMAALGRSGKTFIGKFLLVNAACTLLAVMLFVPFMHPEQGVSSVTFLGSMVELFVGLIPTNIVEPFLEGNTLQIIVMAAATGVAVLTLGDQYAGIRLALRSINAFIQLMMEQLCRLLPGFIVVMMVSQSWSGSIGALLSSWEPVILTMGLTIVFLFALVLSTCVRHHLNIVQVIRICFPLGFLAFTTASASASFGAMLSTCEDHFGVDDEQASFGVPLGMVLCKPATCILLVGVVLYSAVAYNGGGSDVIWFVRLAVTCLLYAVAVPPVPGGTLACYGMLFASLNVPAQAMGVAAALDLLLDNPVCCTNVISLVMRVFSSASSLGTVDENRLKKLRR